MKTFFYYVLLLLVAGYWLKQVRKPTGWVGRFVLWIMNMSHSGLTDWGFEHVLVRRNFSILDVGCGGGRTIEKLSALAASGTIHGVDYAKGAVAASRRRNAALIEAGRVSILHATVSKLPFPDSSFDLITAVKTHYYWPDPAN